MTEQERWRELGQQLRVDSVRAAAAAGSGHPTSSMSAADLMAVLLDKYLRYDFDDPENPANDHLDLLQGPRLAAALLAVQGGRRDHRRGAPHLPQARQPPRGPPDAGAAVGRRRHRLARPGAADRRRASRSPASGSTGCPTASGSLCGDSEMAEGSMWEAFEHAAYAKLDNLTAIIDVNRLGQRGETMHGWDLDVLRRAGPRPSAGTRSRSTATTSPPSTPPTARR